MYTVAPSGFFFFLKRLSIIFVNLLHYQRCIFHVFSFFPQIEEVEFSLVNIKTTSCNTQYRYTTAGIDRSEHSEPHILLSLALIFFNFTRFGKLIFNFITRNILVTIGLLLGITYVDSTVSINQRFVHNRCKYAIYHNIYIYK